MIKYISLLIPVITIITSCTKVCDCKLEKGNYRITNSFPDIPEYKEFIRDGTVNKPNVGDVVYHYKYDGNGWLNVENDTCFSNCLSLRVVNKINFDYEH